MNRFTESLLGAIEKQMSEHFEAAIQNAADRKSDARFEARIESARSFMNQFRLIIDGLPDFLDVEVVKLQGIDNKSRAHKRTFERKLKPEYMKKAASEERESFHAMGIEGDYLRYMQETGLTPPHPNDDYYYYDVSGDHVLELRCGGTNHYNNVIWVPEYFNQARQSFITKQLNCGSLEYVANIVPKKVRGKYPKVPIIPKGFRKSCEQGEELGDVIRSRIQELFGFNF